MAGSYKPKYENEPTGEKVILNIGEVMGIGYRRKGVENDVKRYRLIEKVIIDGVRYQLNGTLTEIRK